MKIFVINLKRASDRKKNFLQNWQPFAKEITFFEAIDGNNLSEKELSDKALHYPSLKLTKGEIACALSHLAIYEKIVAEKIPMALILEDDAILNNEFNAQQVSSLLLKIETLQSELPKNSVLFLQNGPKSFLGENSFSLQLTESLCLKEAESVWLSHAYIITLSAAKKLTRFLTPIRYEADFWQAFRVGTGIRLLAVCPTLVDSSDPFFETSSLHNNRVPLALERTNIRNKQFEREVELSDLRTQFKIFPINHFLKRNKNLSLKQLIIGLISSRKKY